MRIFSNNKILFFTLFFFIYSPFIKVSNFILKVPFLMIAITFILGLFYFKDAIDNLVGLKTLFFLKVFSSLYFLILYYLFYSNADIVSSFTFGPILILSSLFIVNQYVKNYKNNFLSIITRDIFFVGLIKSIIIIICFTSPLVVNIFNSIFVYSDKALVDQLLGFRSSGFLYTGFGALSIAQNFTLICGLHFYSQKSKYSFFSYLIFIISLISIFISIIVSARVGAILAIIILFIFISLRIKKENIFIKKSGLRKLLFSSSLFAVLFINFLRSENAKLILLFKKYLEFINPSTGSFSIKNINSVDIIIQDMIFLPDSFFGLIFGNGDFLQYPSERLSDLGFIIILNSLGLIGLIIILLPYIYIFKLNINSHKLSKRDNNLIYSILFILLISNFKDFYLENLVGVAQILYILIVSMIFQLNQRSEFAINE